MNIIFKSDSTAAIILNPKNEIVVVIRPITTPKTGTCFRSIIEEAITEHEHVNEASLVDHVEFCPTEDEEKEFTVHTQSFGRSHYDDYETYKIRPVKIY